MKKYDLVHVTWLDAVTDHGWTDTEDDDEALEPSEIQSIGYLLREDAKGLVLAATCAKNAHEAAQFIAIPRGMLKGVRKVKLGKKLHV